MRISTAGMHQSALTAMLTQQAGMTKSQNQIASGLRVQTPADDPVAAVHLLELDRALSELDQFGRNATTALNRLTLEEQALADAGNVLQRVQELAVQASNDTVGPEGRRLIATEVRQRLQELIQVANRRDASGEYLFSGYATLTQPFNQNGSVITYAGDQGNRLQQVSPTQRVADGDSGIDVFMNIVEGNGAFIVDAGAANTGTGVMTVGSVNDHAAWIPDDYTLRFITPTTWEVVDSAAAVVTTGTFSGTGTIAFNGVSVGVSGAPAAGDTFSISRSRTEDMFTTLDALATTLETSGSNPSARAQFAVDIARSLQQLEKSSDHLLDVRASVGTRLSALDAVGSMQADRKLEFQRMTAELRDLDYAEAITKMNQQLVGLQAAQASYSRISQLSLFDYLR